MPRDPSRPITIGGPTEILITSDFTSRVIRISFLENFGTAFLLRIAGRDLLITAAHIVRGLQPGDRIGIRRAGSWDYRNTSSVVFGPSGEDVAAIQLADYLGEGIAEEKLDNGVTVLGQRVVYLGFPLGMELEGLPDSNGYPIPLLKTGIFSGAKDVAGHRVSLFETLNNVEFSGGPIFIKERLTGPVRIWGVATGFEFDAPIKIMKRDESGVETVQPDYYVKPNSGFMRGYGSKVIRQLAKSLAESTI